MLTRRRTALLAALGFGAATMTRSDDLTSLFTAKPSTPASPVSYRQGQIQTWNPATLENTVLVGSTLLTNLPVLGVAEAASYREGTVVGLHIVESTWAITGRFVIPGTTDAQDAISQVGQRARTATVATQQSTTSSPFVDLATVGPLIEGVRIPASGKVEVTVSAEFTAVSGSNPCVGTVGVAISGDATVAPSTLKALSLVTANPAGIQASRTLLFEGLPAGGLCTFKLQYGSNGVINMQFGSRDITVKAL